MKQKIQCPKCRSTKVFITKYVLKSSHISESNQKECKCLSCGYEFHKDEADKNGFTPTIKGSNPVMKFNLSRDIVELKKIDWDE